MKMRAFAVLIFTALTACNHLTVQRGESTARPVATTEEFKLFSFGLGFIPGKRLPREEGICPAGRIESMTMFMSGTDVLIATATLGVFVPHRVSVACSKTSASFQ